MSWTPGIETEHPGGRKREVFQVDCDAPDCWAWEVVGQHGGNAEKVQRLLVKRGWGFTSVVDGAKDLCPKHVDVTAVA